MFSSVLTIDLSGIESLSCEDIIKLRQDARIQLAMTEIAELAKRINTKNELIENFNIKDFQLAMQYLKNNIEYEVKEKVKVNQKNNGILLIASNIGFDIIPYPTNNFMYLLTWVRNKLANVPFFKWGMYSPSQILDSFEVIKDSIIETKLNK